MKCNDILGRKKFLVDIAESIVHLKKNDACIIRFYGDSFSDISMLIDLSVPVFKEKNLSILRFNPHFYAKTNSLFEGFFKELIVIQKKRLILDKKISRALHLYSLFLSNKKDQKISFASTELNALHIFLSILSLIGISFSKMADSVIEEIPRGPIARFFKSMIASKYHINSFMKNLSPLFKDIILWSGILCLLFILILKIIQKIRYSFCLGESKTLNVLQQNITSLFERKNEKTVIIIERFDNLPIEEQENLDDLITNYANFPNLVYIISSKKTLKREISFYVPASTQTDVSIYLLETIKRIFPSYALSQQSFSAGFLHFFRDIKSVDMFIQTVQFNRARFYKKTLENKVTYFLQLEILRIMEPCFYNFLAENKMILVEDIFFELQDADKKNYKEGLHLVKKENLENVCSIMSVL